MGKPINIILWYYDRKKRDMRKYVVTLTEITILSLGIKENIHMNHNYPSESLHESGRP